MTLSRHLAGKKLSFLHLEPPYHNISHTCLFVYLNFPHLLEILQCLNAIVFKPMLYSKLRNCFFHIKVGINNTKCPLINVELMKNIYFNYILNDPRTLVDRKIKCTFKFGDAMCKCHLNCESMYVYDIKEGLNVTFVKFCIGHNF